MDSSSGICLRIRQLVENSYNNNNSEFSRATEIPESTIRGYLAGNIPKLDKIVLICEKLAISCDWLVLGKGDIYENVFITNQTSNETRLWGMIDSQQRMLESQQRIIENLSQKGAAEGVTAVAQKAARG